MLLITNIGIFFLFEKVVFNIFEWFNNLRLIPKILLFLLIGFILISALQLVFKIPQVIGGIIFNYLPSNWFTIISSLLLSLANIIMNMYWLWKQCVNYNFWSITELILLSLLIIGLNIMIVIPLKYQQ